MRKLFAFLCLFTFLTGLIQAQEEPLQYKDITLEWVYKKDELKIPPIDLGLPKSIQWSAEGHTLSYLISSATEAPHLVLFNPAKDATAFLVTPFAIHDAIIKLATETEGVKIAHEPDIRWVTEGSENFSQIDRYNWRKKDNTLRVHVDGKNYIWKPIENLLKEEEKDRELPSGEKNDLAWSPNERYAAYTRANDLYAYDSEQQKEIRLTTDGSETILNGRLTWVYWEELHYRRGYRAFYWSPNNDAIAYLQFNEEGVSTYPITDFSDPVPKTRNMFYPKAGTKNPTVRLGVVSLSTRDTRLIDLGEPYEYIARVEWLPDGKTLAVQTLNREQSKLTLLYANTYTGRSRIILQEENDVWVYAHGGPYFIEDGQAFLWLSERDGYRHIYRYSKNGKKVKQLTKGEWEVNPSLWQVSVEIDEDSGLAFFNANESSPLEKQYYSIPVNGGEMNRITKEEGIHTIDFSADKKYAVDRFNNINLPNHIQIIDQTGKLIRILGDTTIEDYLPYRIQTPEIIELENEEDLTFYASMLKPFDFDPNKKYPVVLYVYGGPAGQVVQNTFTNPQNMCFVNRGFIYFSFDTRGTPGRGREWINAIHRNKCDIPLKDLQFAVDYLKTLDYVDTDNIGIWGWSNGGYMTCCAMLKSPGTFRAGAAVAPVTDWGLYDTIYTERYMNLPQNNEEGYKESAPLHYADQLEGSLFIAHGISDDNVHVQNAYNLVDKLLEAEKDYHLFLYPQRDHGIGGNERRFHLFSQILDFFEKELK